MRALTGLAIGIVLAAAALGAPMTPKAAITPPLAQGSLLTELKNPIRRHDVLALATASDAALVQDAFLAGSWDAFDTWAALVLAGKAPAVGKPPDSPHARYWANVLVGPATARDSLLRFLVSARRLHAGLRDPLGRPALPPCDAACEKLLVAYLAAFPDPRHEADPKLPMGPSLVARSHYPDELTVGLSGDLGLAAALPHLQRFIAAPRRFFKLYTDYATQPEEVGGLYWESLRALVKLSAPDPARARAAQHFLAAEIARLTPPAESLALGPERLWTETTSDSPMAGGSRTEVRETAIGGVVNVRGFATQTSKLPSLALAAKAIAHDPAALALLGGRPPLHPEARWIDKLDLSWPAEGRGGKLAILGHRLLALTGQQLTAVDLATGNHIYEAHLEAAGGQGVQVSASTFAVTPVGLVMPASVRPMISRAPEEARLVRLDAATGEVLASGPFPPGPSLLHGPTYLGLAAGGLWYQDDRLALELDLGGKQLDRRTLAQGESLRAAGDKLAHFTSAALTLEGPGGKLLWQGKFADLAGGKDAPVVDDVILRKDDFVFFDRQTLVAADYAGKRRWRGDLTEQWSRPPEPCGDDRIFVLTPKQLAVFGAGGARMSVPVPALTREAAVAEDVAYLLTDRAVVAQPLAGGAPRPMVDKLTGMAHLIGLGDDCLLVLFYESGDDKVASGYYLGCFPLPR